MFRMAEWMCLLALASLPASAQWTNLGGGNHGGKDWTTDLPTSGTNDNLPTGTAIAGVHTNIGTFRIAAGATITVQPYNGTSYGSLDINANTAIVITGTLSGDAAGYLGGAGGAAGANVSCSCTQTGGNGIGGTVGTGPALTGGANGTNGFSKSPPCSAGGGGGGSYGGAGGAGGLGNGPPTGEHCNCGAAQRTVAGGAGHTTYGSAADEVVQMGAGGGGGGGATGKFNCAHPDHTTCGATTGAGLGGAAGGARISLTCLSGSATVDAAGIISANGGAGGLGGCDSGSLTGECATDGGGGGGGAAGGGILVKASSVTIAGTVSVNGGAGGAGGDSAGTSDGCNHSGGGGGDGGGAGRIKVVYNTLSDATAIYQLNGGAAGAGGCGTGAAGPAGNPGGGNTVVRLVCTNCGNTISGTVYSDEGVTVIGTAGTVAVSVNGGAATTGAYSAGVGTYSITVSAPAASLILVYLNNGGAGARGCLYTTGTGANIAGLNLYQNFVRILNTNGSPTPVTNANLGTANNANADIPYSVAAGALTVTSNYTLRSEVNYTPGGTITTQGTGGLKIISGTLDAGSFTHTVTGDFVNNGTFTAGTSTVTLSGSATQTVGGTQNTTFNNLTLSNNFLRQFGDATTGGRTFTVSGTFTWSNGNITIGNAGGGGLSDTLALTNATVANSTITIASLLTLTALNSSSISLAGNWTNNGTFTAGSSLVTLNGSSAQTVGGTQATSFYQLTLNNTSGASPAIQVGDGTTGALTFVVSNTFTWTAGSMKVGQSSLNDKLNLTLASVTAAVPASASLTIDSGSMMNIGGTAATSGVDVQGTGTLQLGASSSVNLPNTTTLIVNSGTTLSTSGTTSTSRAKILASSGNYGVTLGGTANINWLDWDGLNTGGVVVQASATLTVTAWTGIRFANGATGASSVSLDLSAATSATTLPPTMTSCWFSAGPQFNVKEQAGAPLASRVTFVDWGGPLGGESNEISNSNDLVRWSAGVVRSSPAGTFGSIQAALNDAATTSSSVIEVHDNVIRNESITFPAGKEATIDGAVLLPAAGQPAVTGTGSTSKEVLKNCVLISNGTAVAVNVGRMFHCDILGTDLTLLSVTSGNSCTIQNCIVGNASSWTGTHTPVSAPGTFTASYCDFDADITVAPYNGTNNIKDNPTFVNYVPSKGVYDVHLQSNSPCIDRAIAPPVAVTTSFDRGSDILSDPGGTNPARPIDDPNTPNGVGPSRTANAAATYDMGAAEFAPGTVGSPTAKAQSVPLWTAQMGKPDGTGVSTNSDSVPSFDFAPFVLFTGDNQDVTSSAAGKQWLRWVNLDTGAVSGAEPASYDINNHGMAVYRVVHITVTHDLTTSTLDDVYCVVSTSASTPYGDSIVALQYNSTTQQLAPKTGWPTPPIQNPVGSSGRMGSVVIDKYGDLYVVKGNLLYHLKGSDGSGYNSGNWALDGHNTVAPTNVYDPDAGMVSDRFNDIVQVPLTGHSTGYQIARISTTTGVINNYAGEGAQLYELNSTGFNQIGGSIYLTPSQGDFVYRLTTNGSSWPTPVWTSGDLLANVTTRAATYLRADADVRVAAGNLIFRLQKDTGAIAADSLTSGSHDWGTSNPMRGNLTGTPFLIGSKGGVLNSDGTAATGGRTGAKMFFGTNEGFMYVLSYIRDTTGNAAVDGDRQPADSTSTFYATDGRPYPGFPYRILTGSTTGNSQVRVAQVAQGYSTTYSRNLLIFICDNGWIYAFLEPY